MNPTMDIDMIMLLLVPSNLQGKSRGRKQEAHEGGRARGQGPLAAPSRLLPDRRGKTRSPLYGMP